MYTWKSHNRSICVCIIPVTRNDLNHTWGSQTLPTRLSRLITARGPKSLYKTNSLTQTIKHSCEGQQELLEISARVWGESVQSKRRVLKMSRKKKITKTQKDLEIRESEQGAVFNLIWAGDSTDCESRDALLKHNNKDNSSAPDAWGPVFNWLFWTGCIKEVQTKLSNTVNIITEVGFEYKNTDTCSKSRLWYCGNWNGSSSDLYDYYW